MPAGAPLEGQDDDDKGTGGEGEGSAHSTGGLWLCSAWRVGKGGVAASEADGGGNDMLGRGCDGV